MNSQHDCVRSYTSLELRAIGEFRSITLSPRVRRRIDRAFNGPLLFRWRSRGCRGGRRRQRNIPVAITRRSQRHRILISAPLQRPALIVPQLQRHATLSARSLRGGLVNIRSVSNKIENIPDLFEDYKLNFLAITETWHEDSDSVSMRRLRGFGYSVVEAARPIPVSARADDVNYSNHGGIALLSKPGLHFSKVDTKTGYDV